MPEQTLTHHGVEGMKWGIRRYQPYSVMGKGKFLGKNIQKKTPIDTKGLSIRDANAKKRLMTSTTKGKKTIDVNPTAKAKLDKINTKQNARKDKQKTKTSTDTKKISTVKGKSLANSILTNVGLIAVSNAIGGTLMYNGQEEVGAVIAAIGNVKAMTNAVNDAQERKQNR